MAESGRIHTDGSRSGGQPTQSDCEVAASIRSALYRACSNMPNYPKGIVEPFVAAHHRHGYDQGYYDGCTRQPTHRNAVAAAAPADRIGGGGGLQCGVVGVATQSDALLEGDAQTILYLLGVRHGREDERAKIAAEASQPTQSDALREENERLREHLISALDTLKDAEVCDDNCGPCNEARAALEQSK